MVDGGHLARVFDASALIALIKREPGAGATEALLTDTTSLRLVHVINLCEVYYHVQRTGNEQAAEEAVRSLLATGLVTREEMDDELWRAAAGLKAELGSTSLADCFAIALTRRLDGELVSADHGDFDAINARGICRVRFIR